MNDNSQWTSTGSTAVLPPASSPEWVSEPLPWEASWLPPTAPGAGAGGPPPIGPASPPPGRTPPPPRAPHRPGRRTLAAVVVAALISAVIGVGIGSRMGSKSATNTPIAAASTPATTPATGSTPTVPAPASGGGSSAAPATGGTTADQAAVAAKVTPGIVDINTKLSYQSAAAAGTGMVLTSSGEILTNNHVVDGATTISVTIPSTGRTYSATVVGTDPTEDIAVLQLKGASGLKTIPLGNSDAVAAGDAVVALGNAGGVGGAPSVVTGTVQAVGQTITASDQGGANAETLTNLIETDTPIQPGDSGGPLANRAGQVVGMDTAASVSRHFSSGATAAFAIPINHALSIAKQIESGQATGTIHIGLPGFLGVSLSSSASGNGATVLGVASGTPAESAGLAAGDVITAVNGNAISSAQALTAAMQGHHGGDRVQLTWTDQAGASHTANVTLIAGPAD